MSSSYKCVKKNAWDNEQPTDSFTRQWIRHSPRQWTLPRGSAGRIRVELRRQKDGCSSVSRKIHATIGDHWSRRNKVVGSKAITDQKTLSGMNQNMIKLIISVHFLEIEGVQFFIVLKISFLSQPSTKINHSFHFRSITTHW